MNIKKLYLLFNSMDYQGEKNKPLIDYKTLGKIEYLKEIKHILNLKNEIDKDFNIYADTNVEQKLEGKIQEENPNLDKKNSEFEKIFNERRPVKKIYKNLIECWFLCFYF